MYDSSKPVGSRLIEARALCNKCRVPKYELIEDEKIYKVPNNLLNNLRILGF